MALRRCGACVAGPPRLSPRCRRRGTRSARSWRIGWPRRDARRTGSDRVGSWWTSLLGFAGWWEGEIGGSSHRAGEGLFGGGVLVEEARASEITRWRRIVERALPEAVEAEHLLRRDLQGDDDVLQLAALVEHLERLRGNLPGGVAVRSAARGGGADHVGRVVAPDAGGVALRVQFAAQAHAVDRRDRGAELTRHLRSR